MAMNRYLIETLGVEEASKVIAGLQPDAAAEIQHARKGDWYPFETQRLLRAAIVSKIDSSDPEGVTYRLGRFTAQWELSTFLKAMFSFLPLKTILTQSAALWGKYYNQGSMALVEFKKGYALLELSDFPCDPCFHLLTTSWMMVALETVGVENPEVQYSERKEGDCKVLRFELHWNN